MKQTFTIFTTQYLNNNKFIEFELNAMVYVVCSVSSA